MEKPVSRAPRRSSSTPRRRAPTAPSATRRGAASRGAAPRCARARRRCEITLRQLTPFPLDRERSTVPRSSRANATRARDDWWGLIRATARARRRRSLARSRWRTRGELAHWREAGQREPSAEGRSARRRARAREVLGDPTRHAPALMTNDLRASLPWRGARRPDAVRRRRVAPVRPRDAHAAVRGGHLRRARRRALRVAARRRGHDRRDRVRCAGRRAVSWGSRLCLGSRSLSLFSCSSFPPPLVRRVAPHHHLRRTSGEIGILLSLPPSFLSLSLNTLSTGWSHARCPVGPCRVMSRNGMEWNGMSSDPVEPRTVMQPTMPSDAPSPPGTPSSSARCRRRSRTSSSACATAGTAAPCSPSTRAARRASSRSTRGPRSSPSSAGSRCPPPRARRPPRLARERADRSIDRSTPRVCRVPPRRSARAPPAGARAPPIALSLSRGSCGRGSFEPPPLAPTAVAVVAAGGGSA